jgi:hypothetical protein
MVETWYMISKIINQKQKDRYRESTYISYLKQ